MRASQVRLGVGTWMVAVALLGCADEGLDFSEDGDVEAYVDESADLKRGPKIKTEGCGKDGGYVKQSAEYALVLTGQAIAYLNGASDNDPMVRSHYGSSNAATRQAAIKRLTIIRQNLARYTIRCAAGFPQDRQNCAAQPGIGAYTGPGEYGITLCPNGINLGVVVGTVASIVHEVCHMVTPTYRPGVEHGTGPDSAVSNGRFVRAIGLERCKGKEAANTFGCIPPRGKRPHAK